MDSVGCSLDGEPVESSSSLPDSHQSISHDELGCENKESSSLLSFQNPSSRSKTSSRQTVTYLIVASALGLLIIISLLLLKPVPFMSRSVQGRNHSIDCGSSAAEAVAAGCTFDLMSFSWLAPACFDEDLTHEFLALQDWRWFLPQPLPANALTNASVSPPITVPTTNVSHGTQDMLVSNKYHFYHCAFMWRKLHRAAMGVRYVDSYIWNYEHTLHCEGMMKLQDLDRVETMIRVKYPSCWAMNRSIVERKQI